jgi:hypothetical protein
MSFNASTEAIVFSFKGKALRDDMGKMIIFRQLRNDNATGAANANTDSEIWDGAYNTIPAEKVALLENGEIKGLNEFYPVPENSVSA